MNLRFIDWIWHIRGSLPLSPGQTDEEAFDRLAPVFDQPNTTYERTNGALTFQKKDQAAQDKMSVFDSGVLAIENGDAGPVLHYHLISRALLFCFLAPALFMGIAGFTIALGKLEQPPVETSDKADKEEKEEAEILMNPIDKALGAPAPEKPKKEDKGKAEKKNSGPSPTPAYVFTGIFAALYVIGRILEDRLVRSLFRKKLAGS
ncbi:hypothetical protein H0274_02365 [Altererythrobacter sp. CC-YST694]|uniref:hypothetical protein n=1 Tax=Altererythrobacter sp. CC-YST694 TaxID=2755038 RepID=UPI001D01BE81|nr:hypothetical protein [Altererythrobacter sp. CC-YST694]MCB5424091.1 hypothetical protein [Altererythrobacter sp. CC-YST694]